MTPPQFDTEDEVFGVLALLGQTGKARGPRPLAPELKSFLQGSLSAHRRAEIESHIAYDPEIFKAFAAGVRLHKQRKPARGFDWVTGFFGRGSLPAFAAAAVAVAGLTIGISLWQRTPATGDPSARVAYQPPPESTPLPTRDWRRRAFRYGYQHPGVLDRWTRSPGQALSNGCTDNDCGSEVEALTDLGVLVGQLSARCENTATDLTTAADAAHRAQTLSASISDPFWRSQAEHLAQALQRSPGEGCAAAVRLVQAANAG